MPTKAERKAARRRKRLRKRHPRGGADDSIVAMVGENGAIDGVYEGRVPGLRKLSEVIIELVEPYMEAFTPESVEMLIELGIVAWNLANLPPRQRRKTKAKTLRGFPGPRRDVEAFLDELIERKESLFPEDRRFAMDYTYTPGKAGGYLQVLSAMDPADLPG
ncbi:MAG TPA: hypothetical protein VFJ30_10285 [Phycisphaerae bacterium]|nr:hypothetical protein [Phycisphaerae bacterium]